MFETLYTRASALERHRSAPLLEERLGYLRHLSVAGVRRDTLRGVASDQLALIDLLGLGEGDRVGESRVKAAVDASRLGPSRRGSLFRRSIRWLRFASLLEEPEKPPRHAHAREVAIYEEWMRKERGYSEGTIMGHLFTANRFFTGLDGDGASLDSVGYRDIDREVARWGAGGCRRVTVRTYAKSLRAFFRFAESRDWCARGLADGMMPPGFHRDQPIPKGLDREEVVRLLAATEGDRPGDVRSRAVVMLLVTYGLRAGEVAGLRLDDLDWKNETLRVRRPKSGRTDRYPLSRGVGQAILRYLREVRPSCPERALFLTLSAPVRPLRGTRISGIVRGRLHGLGIADKGLGSHALRHGVAQHLLDQGLSMKEVGDYLGHRHHSSTAIYAKVNLGALREVADIDLEGLA
ncbi:MAG: tyrosine-type recombinase/integrase [Gammaproteobacteria bacterium]|nr:tyrosine-type recombinase/integrase [Gammaproteobacteria bacterium]